ncbi:hypothetical protein ACHAXA_000848 [Cyclostephanos tholiformis]|uniref:Cyclic nucleotide-binding domain-containing protein n=1 Tax=Cyclostephanos tholiformis TaxID=382380 RepID=A0ABD3SQJ4_9STRA
MMLQRNNALATMAILAVASTMMCDVGQGLVVARIPFISGSSRNHQFSNRRRSRISSNRSSFSSSSSVSMYIDEMSPLTAIDLSSLSVAAPATLSTSNLLSATTKLISSDPRLEVELLNDVSHVALDVTTFLSPRTAWLRLCNVIGRVLILSSDYIQDGSIGVDEWAFQASMLAMSIYLFARSAAPLMLAVLSVTALSVRDRRAYASLFQAVGLSVLQFKSLLASMTLEWIEFEPQESVYLDGEYMYFLYSGEATMSASSGAAVVGAEGDDSEVSERLDVGSRIIGDVQFATRLEASVYKSASTHGKSDKKSRGTSTAEPTVSRFIVGPRGAALLRISTHKLLKLMKNDSELSASIQRLVLLSMQEKLNRTLQDGGLVIQSSGSSSMSTPNATHVIPTST